MPVELWIAFILVTALVAGAIGYNVARRRAPQQAELDALKSELEAQEKRATEVQANVTDHFEQSALLFGQLARDYRAFLEHFSESAQELGISEVKARELLERADRPLLGHASEVIDATAEGDAAETTAVSGLDEAAAEEADATEVAEALRASASAAPPPAPAPAEAPTQAAQPGGAAAQRRVADKPEPPLIEDVVSAGGAVRAPQAAETAGDTSMAKAAPAALKKASEAGAKISATKAKPQVDVQRAAAQKAAAQGAAQRTSAQRTNAPNANARRANAQGAKAQKARADAPVSAAQPADPPPKVVDVELDALGLPLEREEADGPGRDAESARQDSASGRDGKDPRRDAKRAG